jgi:hypothetical protein
MFGLLSFGWSRASHRFDEDSGEAERHSGMIPNTIGA